MPRSCVHIGSVGRLLGADGTKQAAAGGPVSLEPSHGYLLHRRDGRATNKQENNIPIFSLQL